MIFPRNSGHQVKNFGGRSNLPAWLLRAPGNGCFLAINQVDLSKKYVPFTYFVSSIVVHQMFDLTPLPVSSTLA